MRLNYYKGTVDNFLGITLCISVLIVFSNSSLSINIESVQFNFFLNNVVVQVIIRKLDTTGGIMEPMELSYRTLFYFKLN